MPLENDPFSQSVPVSIAARMAQLTTQQLRRFHERGWLVPSQVDPDTGRRHYTREDVDTARLLSALLRTGMTVSEAGPAVAGGNRQALLDHLKCVDDDLEEIRRLLPPERPGWVRHVTWPMETRMIVSVDLPPDTPVDLVLQEVGACQARAAAARGVGAHSLPRAARPDGLPVGPSVQYTSAPYAPKAIHLPWDDEPAIDGGVIKAWFRGDGLLCRFGDDVAWGDALRMVDDEAERRGAVPFMRELMLSPDLAETYLSLRVFA